MNEAQTTRLIRALEGIERLMRDRSDPPTRVPVFVFVPTTWDARACEQVAEDLRQALGAPNNSEQGRK